MSFAFYFWMGWVALFAIAICLALVEMVRDHLAWRRAFPKPPRAYVRKLRRNRADLRSAIRRAS